MPSTNRLSQNSPHSSENRGNLLPLLLLLLFCIGGILQTSNTALHLGETSIQCDRTDLEIICRRSGTSFWGLLPQRQRIFYDVKNIYTDHKKEAFEKDVYQIIILSGSNKLTLIHPPAITLGKKPRGNLSKMKEVTDSINTFIQNNKPQMNILYSYREDKLFETFLAFIMLINVLLLSITIPPLYKIIRYK